MFFLSLFGFDWVVYGVVCLFFNGGGLLEFLVLISVFVLISYHG